MNIKKLLFENEIEKTLHEIYNTTPFLNHDALPHSIEHLEGIMYIHNNGTEDIPYLMQADGTVVYLNFEDSSSDYYDFNNKNVIIIGKRDKITDTFNVQDIKED